MGSAVLTPPELTALTSRIEKAMAGVEAKLAEPSAVAEQVLSPQQVIARATGISAELDAIKTAAPKKVKESLDPAVYLRSDGSVDWEGVLDGSEVAKKFGVDVWARINGREPNEDSSSSSADNGHKPAAKASIRETPAMKELQEAAEAAEVDVKRLEKEYNDLLAAGVDPTSSVGKVDMSRLSASARSSILASEARLARSRQILDLTGIAFDMERIYSFLTQEIEGATGSIPLNDRLAVAEFGLLESQVGSLALGSEPDGEVDGDVLRVLCDQVTDFKRRLGIDYYVQGISINPESIKKWLEDLTETSKNGLVFYGKGCKLLYNDCVYSLTLLSKALQGVTLKSREVRTLRRTFKDIVTFIPFVIILIIPLTPIGHVLVFGAIQRFWPEFFPSCFTESRQNLLQLFEQSDYKQIAVDETLPMKASRAVLGLVKKINVRLAEVFKLGGEESGRGEEGERAEGGGEAGGGE